MAKYAQEIKLQLEKAVDQLQAARGLLGTGQYEAAASRAALSAVHTGSALLLDEQIEASQHGDVITLVQQLFVEQRRLTREQGEKLRWLFQLREAHEAGAGTTLLHGEAQKALEFAESFFQAAQVILEA